MHAEALAHASPGPKSLAGASARRCVSSPAPCEKPLGFGVEGARAPQMRGKLGLHHLHDLAQVVEVMIGPLVDDVARGDRSRDAMQARAGELVRGKRANPGEMLGA